MMTTSAAQPGRDGNRFSSLLPHKLDKLLCDRHNLTFCATRALWKTCDICLLHDSQKRTLQPQQQQARGVSGHVGFDCLRTNPDPGHLCRRDRVLRKSWGLLPNKLLHLVPPAWRAIQNGSCRQNCAPAFVAAESKRRSVSHDRCDPAVGILGAQLTSSCWLQACEVVSGNPSLAVFTKRLDCSPIGAHLPPPDPAHGDTRAPDRSSNLLIRKFSFRHVI